ncbi:hypothetical protein CSC94_22750 [Zhengella mangrovi]|uniref:Uncharacterized protein n=1 Tax=Zhengella mangrovi TaxID=1982044 RepID=A0A2G1QH25_9HYPH|nr:hypothetical protein [Zhengella mangrovi]PHP64754.1 hypothetical protein CSC94_22750 [Zhengella mangrovi]
MAAILDPRDGRYGPDEATRRMRAGWPRAVKGDGPMMGGFGYGMGFGGGLGMLLILVLVVLAIAALLKYLRS